MDKCEETLLVLALLVQLSSLWDDLLVSRNDVGEPVPHKLRSKLMVSGRQTTELVNALSVRARLVYASA